MVSDLRRYLTGWRGYFGFTQWPSQLRKLDGWLRRRLRCFLWKQWKRGRARFAELYARGVPRPWAAQLAGSVLGAWALSRNPIICPARQLLHLSRASLTRSLDD
ncbi:MAG: group II intron maturase-specific domain-containing protein [Burkholderia gladioli]